MHCPHCKTHALSPTALEQGLVAAHCGQCDGSLLPLLNYRYWVGASHTSEPVPNPVGDVEDNHHALQCPKCQRLMIKYRIGLDSGNKIDLCANCDEVWLDSGEWTLLKQLGFHEQLPNIFTDVWQRNIRRQRQAALQQERYEKLIGTADFDRIKDFKLWLEQHPHKEQIKQYLIV